VSAGGIVFLGFAEVFEKGIMQNIKNEGFNAGLNGLSPRVIFESERHKDQYNQSYYLGLNMAEVRKKKTLA